MKKIVFNKFYLSGNENKYMADAAARGQISGDGYYTKKVSEFLQNNFNLNKVLMTGSATAALEMAAQLIDLKEGDQVIMPSFTFSSTANAVLREGALPVFAEVKGDSFNLDPADFEAKITAKTKAVIPVHYAGLSCEMDQIIEIAEANNLYVIEDAAHAVNSFYQGRALGSLGDFACYSFHGTKNFVSGEGGALVINSEDRDLIEKAEIIREKGTNRSKFIRGEIDKYNWTAVGSSYLPSDILMAFLTAQLEDMDLITEKREKIHNYYQQHLKKFLQADFLESLPLIPQHKKSNYHIYYLKFKTEKIRNLVLKKLRSAGINAATHFQPLHSSPMGAKLAYKKEDLKKTVEISKTILRLPIYPDLTINEVEYIVKKLQEIFSELLKQEAD